ncbi:MAG: 16S rRNA (uracil(1498)-N(3))-methyltransferase [Clostridia bacterium]|nr:16S rRNA (uracil(1498)-N(3))-methyltransferase [Clostridia bacterium]
MPRFFVRRDAVTDGLVHITGEDARHISRSLRMAVGEPLTVCDMQKIEYECILERITDSEVYARILSERQSEAEPQYVARLFQALPKGDKLDSVIQKSVECGVCEITPFESERCVVRMKPDAEGKKTERRQRIAAEAAKQSGRAVLPTVRETVGYSEMLELAAESDVCLFCYEGDGTLPLGQALRAEALKKRILDGECPTVSIVIGSEGGFSLDEVARAREKGMAICGLGKRILRTETAAAFVLGCLVYALELCGD